MKGNKIVYKRTAVYSTIVTSIFLAIIALFQEYGSSYIKSHDYELSEGAKELNEELASDKKNYVDEVANKILSLDYRINTVIISKFEPDEMLPKRVNRIFTIRDRKLTSKQFRNKYGVKSVEQISDNPMIYYSLLSSTDFEINENSTYTFGIIKSTLEHDKNMVFGMYSFNSPSGWVGVIINEDYKLNEITFNKIKSLVYRINLILF